MDPLTLVPFLIAVVAVLASGYAYFRSSAVKVWEQNSAAYQARVQLLEEQNAQLMSDRESDRSRITTLEARIAELEARPNWPEVVSVIHAAEHNIIAAVESMASAAISERTRVQLREDTADGRT